MEAVNPSFHLGRCCPLLKLQLSRIHHGSEDEGQAVTGQPEPGEDALTHSARTAGMRQAAVPPAAVRATFAVLLRAR